ncbi:MAG: four helix bundle protein [Patescibacteria group bacterium]|jgi:four helix bundle protein
MATGLENLWIYKLAEELEVEVHQITKKFPKDEIYRSVDQLRRSSCSVSNNIAESYYKASIKEKTRFLNIARCEAEETKRNILRSSKKDFISEEKTNDLADKYTVLLKGIFAYIKFLMLQEAKIKKPKTK